MKRHRGPTPRRLLVEGADERRVIPYLLESVGQVEWVMDGAPVVYIEDYDGIEKLLAPGQIEVQLKSSGLQALGVIVDANDSAESRWQSIRARVAGVYSNVPNEMPKEGLIISAPEQLKFGAWIMPDNQARGMLETFLLFLRPADNQPLLNLAERAVADAAQSNAPFSDKHRDKAMIHTWLAWQDPPGRQLHQAIMERMLLARDIPCVAAFLDWFCRLYDLTPTMSNSST